MEGINKKYNLEIEVLTPLSIGAGQEKDWVRGVDFVVDKGRLYKLNLKKMIANGVDINDLTGYFASKNELGLKSKLAGKLDEVSDSSMPFPAETDNDVKAFVKNQLGGNPVLTGSSLKGALRSVLFQYLDGKSKDGKEVFGSSKDGDEFMRFFKISDAEFVQTELVNTKIFNLRGNGNSWQGGWKFSGNRTDANFQSAGFNTLYESLMPMQKGYASLMMSDTLFDLYESKQKAHIKSPQKRPILHSGISSLFEIINKHTKDYLLKEKAFFEKYHAERSDEIVDSIDALLNQIPSEGSYCILKMSAGSGFHSITGDWQFDDYTTGMLDRKYRGKKDDDKAKKEFWMKLESAGEVLPKSRKIADWDGNLSLMGFVKLRALSEEEVKRLEENRQTERQHKEQERLAELEAIRVKTEEAAKERREREERKKQFEQSLAEIKQLVDAEQFEDAWSKYQSLCDAFPEQKQTTIDVDRLEREVKSIRDREAIEKRIKEEAEQRRLENAVPLSEKISKAQKLPTLYGNVKQWMKQNGRESLSDNEICDLRNQIEKIVLAMKPRDKKGMKNLGKDLENIVGQDTATKWFNEIVYQ
jgi:hypothetical protein